MAQTRLIVAKLNSLRIGNRKIVSDDYWAHYAQFDRWNIVLQDARSLNAKPPRSNLPLDQWLAKGINKIDSAIEASRIAIITDWQQRQCQLYPFLAWTLEQNQGVFTASMHLAEEGNIDQKRNIASPIDPRCWFFN
ncbi:MAG: hypothetical protein R3C03_21340 [Pirellulaceae bacterium]